MSNMNNKTILLPDIFIKFIPNILTGRSITGTIKNAFSAELSFKSGCISNENASLLILYPITENEIIIALNEITNEIVDNGVG